ncbi:MAG: type IV toxin-antitoxin system AbiEi family antitoxin domain-containing protein [Desulfobacterales bacterium]|nr:type IV toxin-antitoxin system AbiEi family antitoxin domain-containing protein [Desulfobacterales bacterium]
MTLKKTDKKTTPSQIVKNFAAVNGTFTKSDARKALGLSIQRTADAVSVLQKQGHVRRIAYGLYQFCPVVEKKGVEVNDKIWKAMKISITFTAADIARLTDSTRGYVYLRFKVHAADGYIKRAGMKNTTGKNPEKIWRLTQKGKAKAQNPNVEQFKPDPLVMAAVNLNRLICSGVAVRDPDACEQALTFVEEIKNGLQDK